MKDGEFLTGCCLVLRVCLASSCRVGKTELNIVPSLSGFLTAMAFFPLGFLLTQGVQGRVTNLDRTRSLA